MDYVGSTRISLRDTGCNEQWLQNRISQDPSLLGLGEVKIIDREVKQGSRGRLDFLMADLESDVMYEVEMMLGATDESLLNSRLNRGMKPVLFMTFSSLWLPLVCPSRSAHIRRPTHLGHACPNSFRNSIQE